MTAHYWTIEQAARRFEQVAGVAPTCRLACAGYSDEHWQLYHPQHAEAPAWTLANGELEAHPDAPINIDP